MSPFTFPRTIEVAALERRIKDRVRDQIDKNQREYYLREQLKAIHDELAARAATRSTLRAQIAERGHARRSRGEAAQGSRRGSNGCRQSPPKRPSSAPTSTRMLGLPWHDRVTINSISSRPSSILDEDHYGLEKVKERILDFLAVRKLDGRNRSDAGAPRFSASSASGRRQDQPRPLDRPRDGPRVRPRQPGRRARRGRDPRPPAHLHRRDARPDHPGA